MYDDLRRLGMKERKAKRLMLPNIPSKYLASFVRGYFDGDGNIWVGRMHKGKGVSSLAIMTMFTSCSAMFLMKLHKRLLKIGVKGGSLYQAKGNYARLQLSTRDSLRLYDFMYNQDGSMRRGLFLERKKKVFEKYQKLRG